MKKWLKEWWVGLVLLLIWIGLQVLAFYCGVPPSNTNMILVPVGNGGFMPVFF